MSLAGTVRFEEACLGIQDKIWIKRFGIKQGPERHVGAPRHNQTHDEYIVPEKSIGSVKEIHPTPAKMARVIGACAVLVQAVGNALCGHLI